MNRRSFLNFGMKGILAAGVAPYVSTMAGVLMPVRNIVVPEWGVGMAELLLPLQIEYSAEMLTLAEMMELCRRAIYECTSIPSFMKDYQ